MTWYSMWAASKCCPEELELDTPHDDSTINIFPICAGPFYFQEWVVPVGIAPVLNKVKVCQTASLRKILSLHLVVWLVKVVFLPAATTVVSNWNCFISETSGK